MFYCTTLHLQLTSGEGWSPDTPLHSGHATGTESVSVDLSVKFGNLIAYLISHDMDLTKYFFYAADMQQTTTEFFEH